MSERERRNKNKKMAALFATGVAVAGTTLTYILIESRNVTRFKDVLKEARQINEDQNIDNAIEFSDYKDLRHNINELVNKYSSKEKEYLHSNSKSFKAMRELADEITSVRSSIAEALYKETDYSRSIVDNPYLDNEIKEDLNNLLKEYDSFNSLFDNSTPKLAKMLNDFILNNQIAFDRGGANDLWS
ncbi:hypothetical protein [Mycoplasma struthionis]|uniref:Uncharacterized protein n=1 Tax=Mycoplasma struthionis TaxID=538220 RepID=A0A3G8LIE3_9MOLU|nr:hypothetical protein [Mycoplasma struthionis]AZG68428.1 hypothetical protein EGN60_00330 [Mycoplasma struthionis]